MAEHMRPWEFLGRDWRWAAADDELRAHCVSRFVSKLRTSFASHLLLLCQGLVTTEV